MMKFIFILAFFLISNFVAYCQSGTVISKYDTTLLDSNFDIHCWGTEPGWDFKFKGINATGNVIHDFDSATSFTLVDRIDNQGFGNEYVDSYIFDSDTGESITLMLIRSDECSCGYDMGEGESYISAYIITSFGNIRWTLLGCAEINDRP